MASVLMVNLAPEKKTFLKVLSLRLDFACLEVHPADQFSLISDLLSGKQQKQQHGKTFRDEMLIMDGFSREDLNFLLNEMIRTGHTIQLKAVTTPTNIQWSPALLHIHLLAENEQMKKFCPEASV